MSAPEHLQRRFGMACGLPINLNAGTPAGDHQPAGAAPQAPAGPVLSPAQAALEARYEVKPCAECYGQGGRNKREGGWYECDDCSGTGRVVVEAHGHHEQFRADVPPEPRGWATQSPRAVALSLETEVAFMARETYELGPRDLGHLCARLVRAAHSLRLHAGAADERDAASADREQALVGDVGVLRASLERAERDIEKLGQEYSAMVGQCAALRATIARRSAR